MHRALSVGKHSPQQIGDLTKPNAQYNTMYHPVLALMADYYRG